MTTLDQANKIVALFKTLEHLNARLAEIEKARSDGTQMHVTFKLKNPQNAWGDVEGLKQSFTFSQGKINDYAAVFLARLSDETAAKLRKVERHLIELGATLP